MMEICANNLHFQGDTEEARRYDLCIHGNITLKINDDSIPCGTDWCVSASALYFLRSLFRNHFYGTEEHMIPCCGHMMIPAEDGKTVIICGCSNGIDFDVLHEDGEILIRTEANKEFRIPYEVYRNAVLSFARQIESFYQSSPLRMPEDDPEKGGFAAYKNEFYALLDKAMETETDIARVAIRFDDYRTLSDADIQTVSSIGISLMTDDHTGFISFRECAYNYQKLYGGNGRFVAQRDLSGSDPSYVFYTAPLTTEIVFLRDERSEKKKRIFSRKKQTPTRAKRLAAFEKMITDFGYTIEDIHLD